jgi:serine/threonine protein kinase
MLNFMSSTATKPVALKEIKQGHTDNKEVLRQLEEEWQREIKAHNDISSLHHPNIIESIVAIARDRKHYLMFRWSDGGNLREFWQSNKRPIPSPALVKDVIKQLRGLADGLEELHNYPGGAYRHGDLKPENILRVKAKRQDESQIDVGILKIADMGLAKHHTVATEFRPPTSMRYTTYRYEPPEVITASPNQGRSRRYDIWSIGCVILEFITWLLYGNEKFDVFNKTIVGELGEPSPFFEIVKTTGLRRPKSTHQWRPPWMPFPETRNARGTLQ